MDTVKTNELIRVQIYNEYATFPLLLSVVRINLSISPSCSVLRLRQNLFPGHLGNNRYNVTLLHWRLSHNKTCSANVTLD